MAHIQAEKEKRDTYEAVVEEEGVTQPLAWSDGVPLVTWKTIVTPKEEQLVELMIPHILRGCNFPFKRKLVMVDAQGQSISGTSLESKLLKLKEEGWIDEIKEVNYDNDHIEKLYRKVFSPEVFNKTYIYEKAMFSEPERKEEEKKKIFQTQVFGNKGFLSYIDSMEACFNETEYCVHFDIDLVLFSEKNYSWVAEAIKIHDQNNNVFTVAPLSGPPIQAGTCMHAYGCALQYTFKLSTDCHLFLFLLTVCEQTKRPSGQEIPVLQYVITEGILQVCSYEYA